MEAKSVVVIQDASKEVNSRIFEWALHGLSLNPGDKLTLVAVLHQVITPMGYKSSVDSRLMFGANQRIVEAQAARKKEEYLKNEELGQIFNLYKSKQNSKKMSVFYKILPCGYNKQGRERKSIPPKSCRSKVRKYILEKVGFEIELATGSSPKAVALKSAMKLKATWVILDRKMKKDGEYFLQKLSCGISRIRRYNRIVRLRGPLNLPLEIRDNSHEIYDDSIAEISDEQDLFSLEVFPKSDLKDDQMSREQGQIQSSPPEEEGCSTLTFNSNQTTGEINPDQLSMDKKDINSNQFIGQIKRDQHCQDKEQIQSSPHGEERDSTLKQKLKESDSYITCGGSNKETQKKENKSSKVYQKSQRCISFGGARHFFLEGAEEYIVCEQFFSLCNSVE